MRRVGRGVLIVLGVYLAWAAVVVIPGWFPKLPAFPILPSLDPQDVLTSAGLLPSKVQDVLKANRAQPADVLESVRSEVENLRKQFDEEAKSALERAGEHADEARDAVDKERKKREDDLKKLEKAIGVKSPF